MATYPAILIPPPVVAAKYYLPLHERHLCRVYWKLALLTGRPAVNVVVAFSSTFSLPMVGRSGFSGDVAEAQTNGHGEGELYLVRGATAEVSIYGTRYTRTVEIPDRAEQDLLYLLADAPDAFSVQIAQVMVVPRESP